MPLSLISGLLDRHFAGRSPSSVVRDTLAALLFIKLTYAFSVQVRRQGLKKAAMAVFLRFSTFVPGAKGAIDKENKKLVDKLEKLLNEGAGNKDDLKFVSLPSQGLPQADLLKTLQSWSDFERERWSGGKVSGGIYHGGDELMAFNLKVYGMFSLSNPLHVDVFPYVRKMEAEVVRMTLNMFHGDKECCGTMTSGGTESILMAMKTYRDWGRTVKGIEEPEIVAATTAHAAFDKAAHYFGIKLVHVPVDPVTFKLDINAVKSAITRNTVALVGSAPQFAQGVIDPISELSEIAVKRGLGLHVDCCLGGFLLPWLEKLGYNVPLFDFRLPGVTSISADTHKYGYSPKGSSVVMYRTKDLVHHQYFVAGDWPGGIYASPGLPGSRPGGVIAATWATMVHIGTDGYLRCAQAIMKAAKTIEAGVNSIDGLRVCGKPDMSVIAFASDPTSARGRTINILKVAEAMSKRHWSLNTLQRPASVHICCTYMHRDCAAKFLSDLNESVELTLSQPQLFSDGTAAIYGLAETLPEGSHLVTDLTHGFLDTLFKT